ncbi:hypothetical protein C1645_765289 [Glomus cerebriforme]|uniref:SAP domain-containing protein n=1 Tax=Glomus cerebriforme TaxID=658196 RepID=A0A397T220_9GLOM|nr:hypothetical protein C1645_765289 [Glomus cerebriforme]
MSITPNALRNKRKNELKEIASDLGLNTKGLRSELEERIRIHLESSDSIKTEEDKRADAATSKSPRRSFRKTTITNSRVKTRIPSPPNGDRPSSDEDNQSVSSESESKQDVIITQTTSELDISETINLQGLQNDSVFNNAHGSLLQLRKNISNSKTFCKAVTCLEFLVFLYCAIEWNIKIASIPNPFLDQEESNSFEVHGPDVFILVEWHRFWRPLISFIFYLLLLPLGFSYIFNFEPQRHLYSPLTFSVAQYAIFMVSISNFDWADDVRDFIPDNLIYMGAGTGAIFALYESILAI